MVDCVPYAVVGGGLMGQVTALKLAQLGYETLLWTPRGLNNPLSNSSASTVPLTLRANHRSLWESLGLWSEIQEQSSPLDQLAVGYGQIDLGWQIFEAMQTQKQALGFVINSAKLNNILSQAVKMASKIRQVNSEVTLIKPIECGWMMNGTESNHTECAMKVWLCDGVQSSCCEQLGIEKRMSGPIWCSQIREVNSNQIINSCGYQRLGVGEFFGIIPYEDRGWMIHSYIQSNTNEEEDHLARIEKIWGAQWCIGPVINQRLSQLSVRSHSHHQGVLAMGMARLSTPPFGAQGLNRSLDDLKIALQCMQQQPWHLQPGMDWQRHCESRWDLKHQQWLRHSQWFYQAIEYLNFLPKSIRGWTVKGVAHLPLPKSLLSAWGGFNNGFQELWL